MHVNHLYYVLKIFIPRSVQIHLRRMIVRRKMNKYKDIWPIDPKSATPPENWQGWPEGKKFALILTHDVETTKGVLNCRALMDLEEKLGFRSSFNFVTGDYPIPEDLIDEMKQRGFEVGIHGLHHDGNLFRSRKVFLDHAVKINESLKKYDAVGFRSPSMYHNLEWIHELNIEYDASTFDTDPFEPQPDAAGTIFPFWVPGRNGKPGYVELPYTLPQDFLTFILLQERDTRLWQSKLNWIAANGGMVMLISHPDYKDFVGGEHFERYPFQYYENFLIYIQTTYEKQYWHALPRDVSRFWRENYENGVRGGHAATQN